MGPKMVIFKAQRKVYYVCTFLMSEGLRMKVIPPGDDRFGQ